jgi:hypothetical protein
MKLDALVLADIPPENWPANWVSLPGILVENENLGGLNSGGEIPNP